jgi:hypothetical protein
MIKISLPKTIRQLLMVSPSVLLLACGGGGTPNTPTAPTYTVGGTLTGLSAGKSVSISLNGSAPIVLSANGVYSTGTGAVSGTAYAVTIAAQPTKAVCTVTKGTGTIANANVTDVAVDCVDTIVTSSLNTGTGAVGVLATPNARIVFVPSATGIFPVVVETDNGTTVKSKATAALPTLVATSFKIDACAIDSDAVVAICYGYSSSKIATLDLLKFSTSLIASDIKLTEFDTGLTASANFSGGSCKICSVALDIGKQRYAIATSTGYSIYAYGASTKTASYAMPVSENFSLLPGKVFTKLAGNSFLISPDYDYVYVSSTQSNQRKLRVVNLDTGVTSLWDKDTASVNDLGAGSSSMVYSEVDSVAVDPVTGMIVMAFESGNNLLMVDFGQAVFNASNNTFSAPLKINSATSGVSSRQTGVAVTSKGSLAFTTEEFSSTIGATQLATQTGTGGVFSTGTGTMGILNLSASQFNLSTSACAMSSWSGKGDPHGMGLFTSLTNTPVGISLNSTNTCAAIIDLKAMTTFPRKAGSNDLDPTAAGFANLVKFVKVN